MFLKLLLRVQKHWQQWRPDENAICNRRCQTHIREDSADQKFMDSYPRGNIHLHHDEEDHPNEIGEHQLVKVVVQTVVYCVLDLCKPTSGEVALKRITLFQIHDWEKGFFCKTHSISGKFLRMLQHDLGLFGNRTSWQKQMEVCNNVVHLK